MPQAAPQGECGSEDDGQVVDGPLRGDRDGMGAAHSRGDHRVAQDSGGPRRTGAARANAAAAR
eukprot:5192992-Pyramimonas_sp.AAC.1